MADIVKLQSCSAMASKTLSGPHLPHCPLSPFSLLSPSLPRQQPWLLSRQQRQPSAPPPLKSSWAIRSFQEGSSRGSIQVLRRRTFFGLGLTTLKRNGGSHGMREGSRKIGAVSASLSASAQVAAALFTFATAFVMPLYTTMIFAPHWPMTRRFAESSIPYIVLGSLYLYLLSLSWTPETLPLMFSSKYWLPELPGITRMFSSTLTVASAWIHLLAVDLFAARQVFLDGLQHKLETRHSLVLCLMFGPIGILSHTLTKLLFHQTPREDADALEGPPLIQTSVG